MVKLDGQVDRLYKQSNCGGWGKGLCADRGFNQGEQYEDSIGDLERTPCYTKPYGKEIQKQAYSHVIVNKPKILVTPCFIQFIKPW